MLQVKVTNEVSEALLKYRDQLQRRLVRVAGDAWNVIVAQSQGEYMRDAKGEPKRRSPSDTGPLRIVTGRLVRSLFGARSQGTQPESIYNVRVTESEVVVTFGSRVPYSAIHEYGGVAGRNHSVVIPGRPYMAPALADETQRVVNMFDAELVKLARELDL